MLDLSALESALAAMERALSVTADAQRWRHFDMATQEALKSGVIQTFEVTYEQSWKMMRRWLAVKSNFPYLQPGRCAGRVRHDACVREAGAEHAGAAGAAQ